MKDIEETIKRLKGNVLAGDYGISLGIVVDNVRKLIEASYKIAELIDSLISEIVSNVNMSVSAFQDSIGNETPNSEEFNASVGEVSSAIDEMINPIDEISRSSQEMALAIEFLSKMTNRLP